MGGRDRHRVASPRRSRRDSAPWRVGTGFHDEWSTVWGGVWEGASLTSEALTRRAGSVSRTEASATVDARGGAGVGRIERRRFGDRPPDPLRGPRQRAGDFLGAKACVAPASGGTAHAWPQPRGVLSSEEDASSSSRRSFSRARASPSSATRRQKACNVLIFRSRKPKVGTTRHRAGERGRGTQTQIRGGGWAGKFSLSC